MGLGCKTGNEGFCVKVVERCGGEGDVGGGGEGDGGGSDVGDGGGWGGW